MYKNDTLIRILIILFALRAIFQIINLFTNGIDIYYLVNIINENPVADQFENYWILKSNIIFYTSILFHIITLVPFVVWFYREYSNIHKMYINVIPNCIHRGNIRK